MKTTASFGVTDPPAAEGVASWYVSGLADGFGDRLLMFDNVDSNALEMLRFRAALVDTPGFEEVLSERVRQFGRLTHAAFPLIRAVKRLETDGSLVLVSKYQPGRRLSEFLAERRPGKGLHPAFVTWVVSQVMQPLSVLQAEGEEFTHSALTSDRIILTADGRVRVVEHVLGSALKHLDLTPTRLWSDFGLVVPGDQEGSRQLDARVDVFQVGVMALSMLLARRLTPVDLDQHVPQLLEQWSNGATARSRLFSEPLRLWLERMLQLGDRPYRSAAEAYADLRTLPSASAARAFELLQAPDTSASATPFVALQAAPQAKEPEATRPDPVPAENAQVAAAATPATPLATPVVKPASEIADFGFPVEAKATVPLKRATLPRQDPVPPQEVQQPEPSQDASVAAPAPLNTPRDFNTARDMNMAIDPNLTTRMRALTSRSRTSWSLIAAGLAVVAVAEAIVIALLFLQVSSGEAASGANTQSPPTAMLLDAGESVPPVLSAGLVAGNEPASPEVNDTIAGTPDAGRPAADDAAAIARAATNQRSGGVRLSAPIALNVLQGDRVLGSSADGPIVATAGTHQLDLINTAYGFRTRRMVTFRAGEIMTVPIAVPPGRISINAAPWAEVWIDNRQIGQTPLANLEIPIGEHEVVFRHPELGERRQNVTVRADAVARASTTFDR